MPLDYTEFDTTVIFKVHVVGEPTIIPSYEIDKLLDERVGMFDAICVIEEDGERIMTEWLFAYDASVADPLADVRTMLDRYNEFPDDHLPDEAKDEWNKSYVQLQVVCDERR